MPTDELIRAIEKEDRENIQDILDAVICRYRELNPDWEIVYYARKKTEPLTSMEEKILQRALKMES